MHLDDVVCVSNSLQAINLINQGVDGYHRYATIVENIRGYL